MKSFVTKTQPIVVAMLVAVISMTAATGSAYAAASDDTFVSLARIVLGALGGVVGIAIGFVIKRVIELTGIQIEAKHREALQSALENAARLALGLLESKLTGKPVDRSSPAMLSASDYVKKSVPDAVKHFKLSDDKIIDLINPKLIPKA